MSFFIRRSFDRRNIHKFFWDGKNIFIDTMMLMMTTMAIRWDEMEKKNKLTRLFSNLNSLNTIQLRLKTRNISIKINEEKRKKLRRY